MATLEEFFANKNSSSGVSNNSGEDFNFGDEDSGWITSMAAAVPSGIFKIFEGVATLGATLMDLGVDKSLWWSSECNSCWKNYRTNC